MPPSFTVSHSIPGAATSLDPHASLLSNVSFLRNFSRYPVLNRTLINIFEGQIITILVIICFILVILEQHQHQHQHENDEEQRMAAQVENLPGPDDDWIDQDDDGSAAEWQNQDNNQAEGSNGPFAQPQPRSSAEEQAEASDPVATVHEYLRIYRQSNGDPHLILQAIQDEGLEDKLGYWARVTSANADFLEAKGKEKEYEVPEESQASPIASGSSSSWNNALRPRWSFSALPAEAPARPDDAWERTGAPRTPTPVDWTWTPAAGEETEELQAQIDASNLDDLDHASLDVNHDGADIREHEPVVANAGDVAVPQRPPLQRGVMDRLADFMWDGIEARELDIGAGHADILDADHVHDNVGDDELFEEAIPLEGNNPNDFARDPEVVEAAVAAGLDPEAMDDAEDIEGVLELIGMRGPLVGLFQNAVFCAVLVSVTIFICVFIPYNIGRVSVWAAMNPMRLVRMLFSFTKFIQDVANFSAISHEALQTLKSQVASLFVGVGAALDVIFDEKLPSKALHFIVWAGKVGVSALDLVRDLPHLLLNPASWVISFDVPDVPVGVDPALASWSGPDRFWAILCGYLSMSGVGALYLRRGTPFSNGQIAQEWEASLIDLLNQASGVMKVILIISIEMLAFPLYCGLLLDAALLPLFEDASLKSRMAFTINYPLTSIFVHWFVGTGYMFHFALFVSMCRKIMRKGVLYFIRDPDDPDFHPVRDVLERNVVTQLRKILFSAFVYGALVIVCLGGVVWGLSFTVPNVLPIHYSSNEPVLEFPIDLLFYNFAMPLAVKFFRPSDGLHAMYTWWLRKCARGLRLTWFLFGERRIDEEGTLVLRSSSRYSSLPWWKRFFLEVNQKSQVVPKRWKNTFKGGTAKPSLALSKEKFTSSSLRKRRLVESGQLIKDGVFVRTPGSDQVKIPKGDKVFMEVSEDDERMDGKPDLPDTDLYSSDQYQLVYLPPHFKARIFLFILFIWVFAAVTGVGFTIVPLVFGRKMFEILIPAHIRTNDIYAFSIGIYILGSAAYLAFHLHSITGKIRSWSATALRTVFASEAPARLARFVSRAAKLVYTYTILLVVFPLMLTSLMELYLIIPLHTYVNPPSPYALPVDNTGTLAAGAAAPNQHTARVIQSWTLGLLYVKLGARIITSLYEGHRPAHAVRAVLRRGWLDPDAGVLTRAFVIPGLFVGGLALFGPAYGASLLEARGMLGSPSPAPHELKMVYRLAYPAAAFSALAAVLLWSVLGVFHSWKVRIRDEAYLIGERLHNFGMGTVGATAGRAQWRGARM
ncbi:ERAD-associated E3 ubiquitin-protein ligase doa10 like [Verticillium longisporum]|uniref:RING-type E3 ubiquitin transferase n=1 Tax=Verticillium longisporum TaxID=100787 RepID=A0A8I3ARD2_VERLO|nr:ERAD-associated E3 ubiquitin-protein ligase doa10 like [Verticillium longisporum]